MSVDIVGSTAYKQDKRTASPEESTHQWIGLFTELLLNFQSTLGTTWGSAWQRFDPSSHPHHNTGHPEFWKARGDEVIFFLDLHAKEQAHVAIQALISAINTFKSETLKETDAPFLNLKGTAWLAEFPVNNIELIIGEDIDQKDIPLRDKNERYILRLVQKQLGKIRNPVSDFIGPQIDLGFRLAEFASPMKLILSADLVYLLIDTYETQWGKEFEPLIYFDGAHPLAGVLSGNPYPIFWVNAMADDPLTSAETKLRGRKAIPKDTLKTYLKEFSKKYTQTHSWVILPFFCTADGSLAYGSIPDNHGNGEHSRYCEKWQYYQDLITFDPSQTEVTASEVQHNKFEIDKLLDDLKRSKLR
ncbi:MAG: hypothetical protein ACPGOY_10290 [Rhodospirillaceae bacterium]